MLQSLLLTVVLSTMVIWSSFQLLLHKFVKRLQYIAFAFPPESCWNLVKQCAAWRSIDSRYCLQIKRKKNVWNIGVCNWSLTASTTFYYYFDDCALFNACYAKYQGQAILQSMDFFPPDICQHIIINSIITYLLLLLQ